MSSPIYIFNWYNLRTTDGGPSGFLAQNILNQNIAGIELGKFHPWSPTPGWRGLAAHLPRATVRRRNALGLRDDTRFEPSILSIRSTFLREQVAKRPIIWFHDVISLGACLDLVQTGQHVILQSHCPQIPSEEVREAGWSTGDVDWLAAKETAAFERADLVILPNEGCRGIYAPFLSAGQSVMYLESGSEPSRRSAPPPLDPAYIYYLFLGRRIPIKGFDLALEGFRAAYRHDSRLRLVLVGNGTPVTEAGVLDMGFSDRPLAWLAAVDYVLNVNRRSYFDLGVMEALAEGTPLLATITDGHRILADIQSSGIRPIAEPSALAVTDAILSNRLKRNENGTAVRANRYLFESRFSSAHYRARLTALIQSPEFETALR